MSVIALPRPCECEAQVSVLRRFNFHSLAAISIEQIQSLVRCHPAHSEDAMIVFPIHSWSGLLFDIRKKERRLLDTFVDSVPTARIPYTITHFTMATPQAIFPLQKRPTARPLTLCEGMHFAARFPGILRTHRLMILGSKDTKGRQPALWHSGHELRIAVFPRDECNLPEFVPLVAAESIS